MQEKPSKKENKEPIFNEVPTAKEIEENAGIAIKLFYQFKDEKEQNQFIMGEYKKLIGKYRELIDTYYKHVQYSNTMVELKNVNMNQKDQLLIEKELMIAQLQNKILKLEEKERQSQNKESLINEDFWGADWKDPTKFKDYTLIDNDSYELRLMIRLDQQKACFFFRNKYETSPYDSKLSNELYTLIKDIPFVAPSSDNSDNKEKK